MDAAEVVLTDPLIEKQLVPPTKPLGWRGYLCCAGVIFSWVMQSEVCQAVQVNGYNKPMAITWLNHSAAILVLPLLLLGGGNLRQCWSELTVSMTSSQLVTCTFGLATVYLFADWFWYIGLPVTSVAAGTAIFNTSSCWVYVLSVATGQPHRWRQTAAVVASAIGVAIVCCKPGDNLASDAPETQDSQLLGNCFVLVSAFGYAVYEVFLDKALVGDGIGMLATSTFVSLSGLLTASLLWPVIVFLGAPGVPDFLAESPELPMRSAAAGLAINAFLATLFNVLLALCVVATSPLITSVACMLTIPTSMVVDAVAHGDTFGALELTGSVFIVAGFLLLVFDKAQLD